MSAQGPANTGGILSSARGVASQGITLPIIGPVSIGAVLLIGFGAFLLFRRGKKKVALVTL